MTVDGQFVHDMKNLIGIMIGFSNLVLEAMPADDPNRADVDEIRKAAESSIVLLNDWEALSTR